MPSIDTNATGVEWLKLTPSLCRHFRDLRMHHKILLDFRVPLKLLISSPLFSRPQWLSSWSSEKKK